MPKATLTFNLPEEQHEYRLANKAGELSLILWDFTQLVRSKTKHGDPDERVSWEEVREVWWNLLKEADYDPYAE